jgi:hypothetical protein
MQRAGEMAKLRSQGLTTAEIAERYSLSHHTVYNSIKAAIAATPYEGVTELRHIQLDSLALQKRRVLRIFLVDHPKVDHGRLIKDSDGNTVNDYDIALRASAELRRIEDSISRLTGTRAPVVHEVHEITEDALDAEIRRLTTAVRAKAAGLGEPIDVTSWPTAELDPPAEAELAEETQSAGG